MTARSAPTIPRYPAFSMTEKAPPERITDCLVSWAAGDKEAGNRLFTVLYAELRRVAKAGLRGQAAGNSLDTAALIHDTYIKLTAGTPLALESRAHFLSLASRTMRQIIVDHARRKAAIKRGGELLRISTLSAVASDGMKAEDILALEQALAKLEAVEPQLTRMVDMRYFGGLTMEETAQALGISTATAKRYWLRARAFLFQQLQRIPNADHGPADPTG